MEMFLVFGICAVALVGLIAYMRKSFNEGDACAKCSGGKGKCAGGSTRRKCL